MRQQYRFSIGYVIAAFVLLLGLHNYFLADRIHEMPYSEFKQAVSEGRVGQLTIADTLICGTMR